MNPFNREAQPLQWGAWDAGYAAGTGKIDRAEFGRRISAYRQGAGLTMTQLAATLSVSVPTVWGWEKGNIMPNHKRIPAIAAALGVDQSALRKGAAQ